MKLDRFAEILDAYGADSARWPESERLAAHALLEQSPLAQARLVEAQQLDSALDLWADAPLPQSLLNRLEAQLPLPALATMAQPHWHNWLAWMLPPAAAMAMGLMIGVSVAPPIAITQTEIVEDLPTYGLDVGVSLWSSGEEAL